MNLGAVFTPVGDFGSKLNLLQRMNPDTVRISQYWGGNPIFSYDQLQQIVNVVGTEVIIQSSERPSAQQALDQLNGVLSLIRNNSGKYFVFEIGNEPDQPPTDPLDPTYAGQLFVSAWQNCKNNVGDHADGRVPNLWYAINQPSSNASADYWNTFNAQGVLDAAEYATVHCYGDYNLCRDPSLGNSNPWKVYDWVHGARPGKPVKITEAGIGVPRLDANGVSQRGYDYVEGARVFGAPGNTADSICFYGLPDTGGDRRYNLTNTDMDELATRSPSYICG